MDTKSFGSLVQPFIQWKGNLTGDLSITAGLHSQVLELGNNMSGTIEPRLGVRYRLDNRNTLGFGTGLHSQILPAYIYFARMPRENGPYNQMNSPFIYLVKIPDQDSRYNQPNSNLDFIKSYHAVLSWDYVINKYARLKIESYYQYLYNVPVERSTSSYSVLDEGHNLSRFFPDSLVNKGKGRNMGLELTLEKFFSNSYFFMLTASLYDSKRTGSDDIYYDAIFNGRYILNALASKEFSWGELKKSNFMIGGKLTVAGGKRYTPVDIEASELKGEAVYIDEERNNLKFGDYFRFDVKLNYRLNLKASTHELGLDIVNVTNHSNILKQTYVHGDNPPLINSYQLGTLPIFYYRIDF